MTASDALDTGRAAFAERRWAEAHERLAEADSAGGISPADLELLATAAFLRGRGEECVSVLTRAHAAFASADDAEGAARTAAWLALYQIELGDLSHNFEWVPRGLRLAAAVRDSSSVIGLVRLPPAIAQLASGDPVGAEARFREIGDIADRTQDPALAALALFGRGMCLTEIDDGEAEGMACLDAAAAAVSDGKVSPVGSGIILSTVVSVAHTAFDLTRAIGWTKVLDDWCRDQPELVAYSGQRHALRAALLLLQGAWAEAAAAAELAMARLRAGDYRAAFGAPYWFGEVQRLLGAFHSAAESYRRAGATAWDPQPGSALLDLAEGRVSRARDEIRRTASAVGDFARRHLLPAVVEIEVAAGETGAARAALRDLLRLGASASTPMFAAVRSHAEAQVLLAEGDGTGALEAARAAADAWRRIGAPHETARSRVLAGRALHVLGEPTRARAEFDAARAVFLELGADPALAELSSAAGERRGSLLTGREVEVLRLVSTGLTNRAIGERLSLSEKTVARHLSNIFGKLGLSTRAAATAYAYENGLV
ncbi:DNA-binding NarL/FixJ family response regulator [Agromyces flavus]|uniref:DNA-binding NarL/FixJ family response regulator n=1 Tax=Agromyces flavus TaxID=589382 RepID=A0A1H1XC48_9MICO|nr:helix-turn-helix transcriptional regulator [Agromyces flavus]MCP2366381.1 DNA-binding NarL/FixJ family response regulator [Agromyces flavus]GGI44562.1 helix-turn-helix transcriptional regulator [Agromyces flavus]SDT06847.1 regulatory protein, luxR family [Agromyces flavus]